MEKRKLCPLAAAHPNQEDSTCLGKDCAIYVRVLKPRVMSCFGRDYVDPEHYLAYEGCGLVNAIPWELKENVQAPKTSEDKQAQEAYAKL